MLLYNYSNEEITDFLLLLKLKQRLDLLPQPSLR